MSAGVEQGLKSFKSRIKSLTGGHFWLRYPTLAAYRALCAGASAVTGRTMSGAAHAERNEQQALEYITSVFSKYKAAAGVTRFYGRVAEIGPGDSCGVGLMFLADGCSQVDLVDRFFSKRVEQQQQAINRLMVERMPQLIHSLKNGNFSETSFKNLARHYGPSAAAETFFNANRGYDFIVSCAVMEHVYDPLRSISAAASALNPGGMMLHQVDCRDHGQFSEHFHELKFLEIPERMYAPLRWGGGPNRVRLTSYLKLLKEQRVEHSVYITSLAGVTEEIPPQTPLELVSKPLLDASRAFVSSVRGRLGKPFRDLPDEDLMISSFMLVARKGST
ncbi:MAG TPA: methyltransferase domain-containing protein [Candidatus Angelobacter sp.]